MDPYAALAVPIRRTIVELLAERGQQTATQISEQFNVTAAAISHHLKILREARIVTMKKQAQQRIYALNPESLQEIEAWTRDISARYDRLDAVLQELKRKQG